MTQLFAANHGFQPSKKLLVPTRNAFVLAQSAQLDQSAQPAQPKLRLVCSPESARINPDPTEQRLPAPTPSGSWKTIAHEDAIIAVLARTTPPGELPSETFRRKEAELGEWFAQLSVVDSLSSIADFLLTHQRIRSHHGFLGSFLSAACA